MRIAFDVGGVLSRYPEIFRPLLYILHHHIGSRNVEVLIISDMHPKEKIMDMLARNDFGFIDADHVYSADYQKHGENCKAVLCQKLGIDILVDDFIGYVATVGSPPVRLLVMPDPSIPYYATAEHPGEPHWYTDGSEGTFGRRNPPGSKRPPEDRLGKKPLRCPERKGIP